MIAGWPITRLRLSIHILSEIAGKFNRGLPGACINLLAYPAPDSKANTLPLKQRPCSLGHPILAARNDD
jgi:hypothetical protein